MRQIPVVSFDYAYHIGTLAGPPNDDERSSYEGACLSASHVPGAWARIARTSGPLWRLKKTGAPFLDAHALRGARRRALYRYAVTLGLLAPIMMWRVSYFDDEMNDTLRSLYRTYNEGAAEAESAGVRTMPQRSYETTTLLTALFKHKTADGFIAQDWAMLAVAELHGLDGVWWNDHLDVARYSAPRIGIFRSALDSFTRKEIAWRDHLPTPTMRRSHIPVMPQAEAQAVLIGAALMSSHESDMLSI